MLRDQKELALGTELWFVMKNGYDTTKLAINEDGQYLENLQDRLHDVS